MKYLSDKKWFLVIGAAGGIGQEIVRILQSHGHITVGVDSRRVAQLNNSEQIVATLPQSGFKGIAKLIEEKGVPFGVVFAQGIYRRQSLDHYTQTSYRKVFATNLDCVFWLLKKILPLLIKAKKGKIIVIGSQAGAMGGFDPVYAASKAAVAALVKSIAREYGRLGVVANVVAPDPVETSMSSKAMSVSRINFYKKQFQ